MKRKVKTSTILAATLAICLTAMMLSCSKMAQERIEAQEKSLESYISTRMRADTLLRRSIGDGVNYLYRPGDTTRTRQAGDTITFNYIGRLFSTRNDSIVFDTNIPQLARRMGIDLSDRRLVPLTVAAGSSGLIEGLNKGLMMTHPRDTGEIIFNSDLGFGSSPNGMIPSNSPLIYTVYMLR